MGVKTEVITGASKTEKEYPVLRIADNGLVVLFTALRRGMVVSSGACSPDGLGSESNNWAFQDFSPFTGKVILANE